MLSKQPAPKAARSNSTAPAAEPHPSRPTPTKSGPAHKPTPACQPGPAPASKSKSPKKASPDLVPAQPIHAYVGTSPNGPLCGLTARSARFVDLYLLCFNAGQAYIDAGFTAATIGTAHVGGSRLLSSAKSRRYLAGRINAMFESLAEQQGVLMRSLVYTAYADPRELIEHYRGACRFCHGKFNRWQYTAGEWDGIVTKCIEKQERAAAAGLPVLPEPDTKGGTGYSVNADPNPDCPECGGEGRGRTVVKDTRHLSPAGVALYAGVKETRDGIEVKMHDQLKARETLARIAKLYDDATAVNMEFDAAALSAKYADCMHEAAKRMAAMREERRKLRHGARAV